MIPEQQRQTLRFIGAVAQFREVDGLADQEIHLLGQWRQLTIFIGDEHHRILKAYVFPLRERIGQQERTDSRIVLRIFLSVAAAIGKNVEDRDVHGGVPRLAALRIDSEEGIHHQHIRQDLAVDCDQWLRNLDRA